MLNIPEANFVSLSYSRSIPVTTTSVVAVESV